MNQIESIEETKRIENEIKEINDIVKRLMVKCEYKYDVLKASKKEIVVRIWLVS